MSHTYNNLSDVHKAYCIAEFERRWPDFELELFERMQIGGDFEPYRAYFESHVAEYKRVRLEQIARGCIAQGIFVIQ